MADSIDSGFPIGAMDADSWRRKQVMEILTEDNRIHRLQEYVMKKKMEETEFEKEK